MSQSGPPSAADPHEARFRRLYEANYEALLGYALRRCGDLVEAHDVVADTFLVLWRRLSEAPRDQEIPLWLYGVARRVLANRYRSRMRAERLVDRLGRITHEAPDTEERALLRETADTVLRSLRRLDDEEREILLLATWERLPARDIAVVLGCSPNAAAIRLHRARRRLTEVYKKENERGGHRKRERPQLRRPPVKRPE